MVTCRRCLPFDLFAIGSTNPQIPELARVTPHVWHNSLFSARTIPYQTAPVNWAQRRPSHWISVTSFQNHHFWRRWEPGSGTKRWAWWRFTSQIFQWIYSWSWHRHLNYNNLYLPLLQTLPLPLPPSSPRLHTAYYLLPTTYYFLPATYDPRLPTTTYYYLLLPATISYYFPY